MPQRDTSNNVGFLLIVIVVTLTLVTLFIFANQEKAEPTEGQPKSIGVISKDKVRPESENIISRSEARQVPPQIKESRNTTDPLKAALKYPNHVKTFAEQAKAQAEAEAEAEIAQTQETSEPSSNVSVQTSDGLNWAAVAQCESGGNPATNTGNGYYGLYQFSLSTWQSVGGAGYPNEASAEEQTYRAQILLQRSGDEQWPVCGDLLYT